MHKLDAKTDLPLPGEPKVDDFGYGIVPPKEELPPPPAPKPPEPPKLEDIKDPATGYGKEPPKPPKLPDVIPPEPPKVDLGYELEVANLDPKIAQGIKDFAKKNSLTKEAAQAFVELKRSEVEENKQYRIKQQELITKTKNDWDNELRTHPTFGGENFAQNVMKVEKVLLDHMPETKKFLTEKASMLPPYVMRDFAKLADHLFGTENLKTGDPHAGDPEDKDKDKKENNPLDFYS